MELKFALLIIAFISLGISILAGKEGSRRARNFDWEAYTNDVSRQKYKQRVVTKFTAEKIIADAKASKRYVVGVDTNILIDDYMILYKLADEQIALVISERVRSELDGLKKNDNEEVRKAATAALKSIYNLELEKKLKLVDATAQEITERGLDAKTADDHIIVSYLNHTEPVLFFTNDNNARLTAKQQKLHVQELRMSKSEEGDPFKIKPGNRLKWISVITYSIGFGIMFAYISYAFGDDQDALALNSDQSMKENFQDEKLNLHEDGRFVIKNEFNTVYFGDYNEEWGGVALYDIKKESYQNNRRRDAYENYTFDLAFYIDKKKQEDFSDIMKIKISDGTATVIRNVDLLSINDESKVRYTSTASSVRMFGVNSAQAVSVNGNGDQIGKFDLSKTVITIYNSMTEEAIFRIQASVHSKQLEGNE